jgi:type I restriction enzyme S subunit
MLSSHEERELIPWTGDVPERWKVMKGKDLFVLLNREVLASDGTVTVFRDGAVTLRSKRRLTGFTEATYFSGYQGVEPGDLVIHQMDAFAGAVGVSDSRGKCSPVCAVCKPRAMANQFYYSRLIKVMAWSGWISALSKGIRVRSTDFRFSVFKQQWLPVPPLEEQGLIVRYLNHAELRIAKAIAAKTELARLLQQQRLALLCSEVLGRDEDNDISRDFGRLVESRVLDWVGPVPKSWVVVPMSGVFDVVKQKNIGLIENTVLSLSYGRVVIKPAEKLRGLVPESFETYQIIEPGDVIVRPTDLQNDTTSLRIGQARDRGIITSAYIALRPRKHVDPDYVMMQLAAYDFLKVLYGFGSGLRQNLDFKHLKHAPMMLPSLAEQSAIVSRVRAKTESVEKAHAAILQEIALLKEYRTRLISDVVTGKLDVRDEAAKLPEIDPVELATVAVGENGDDEEATDDD